MPSAAPRPDNATRIEPFRLRGANFNLLVLRLLDHRPEVVVPAIGDQFRRAPGFLRFAPIVLGLNDIQVPPAEVDFPGLIQGLKELEIMPIGTTGGTAEMRNVAISYGLPPVRSVGGKETDEDITAAPAPAANEAAQAAPPPPLPITKPAAARATMVVDQPVRAGQRIWAEGSDLIITSTVNAGAEVIADGNIHVYGALRGRAIAGGADNMEARVFALNFDPELVSIAGFYAVREGFPAAQIGKAMQVRLVGERMRFDPIT
ncbi:MAG: septum site-determining protein MinC [Roseomonas sp.]|nr:septum site-determining protein MinC [Roseomonas sp.]MCA3318576.1 septum site-determining protein MinC [Roseomonas sp.]MCA3320211.1 septum site-determining protein MinC [Roseomonas sp.]